MSKNLKNQIKQNAFFKNILTTSAIVAVGMAPMSSAYGALRNVGGAPVNLTAVAGPWANNDSLSYNNNAGVVTFNDAHTVTSIGIEDGINPTDASVIGANVTIGAISNDNTGAVAGGALALDFSGDHTLTLSGVGEATPLHTTAIAANAATTYDKIGTIDFQGNAGTVIVSAGGVTLGAIDSTVSSGGTVNVTGNANKIGAIGGTNAITLLHDQSTGGTTTYTGTVDATTIKTSAGAVDFQGNVTGALQLTNNGSVVGFSANGKTLTGNVTNTTGSDNKGTINIEDNTTITGNVGTVPASLALIDVTAQKVLTLNGSAYAAKIQLGNHANTELVIGGNNSMVADSIYAATVGTAKVTVNATDVNITKIENGLRLLTINDGKDATISSDSKFDAGAGNTSIVIGDGSTLTYLPAVIEMDNGATVEGANAGEGTLVIRDGLILDTITAPGDRIGVIGGNKALSQVTLGMNGTNDASSSINFGTVANPLELGDAINATTLHLVSAPDSVNSENTIHLLMDASLDGVGTITSADSSSKLIVNADHTSKSHIGSNGNNVNIHFTGNKTLTLNNGGGAKTLYVNIDSGTANQGTVTVAEAGAAVHGNIGSATAANNILLFNVTKGTDFGGNMYAPVSINDGIELDVVDANTVFHSTINGGAAAGQGDLKVSATGVRFDGVIGGTNAPDHLTLADNATATLNANATFEAGNVQEAVVIGNGATLTINSGKTLTLNAAGEINGTGSGKGTLVLNGQTIAAKIGANNGGNNTGLANIKINGDTTLSGGVILANAITFDSNNATLTTKAFTTGTLAVTAGVTGTKLSLTSGEDGAVNGNVGAFGEIHFLGDDTLTVTDGNFDATKVTSATDTEGTIHIKSGVNRTISSDFGDVTTANTSINTLHLENTDAAAKTFTLKGCISANTQLLLTTNHADTTLEIGNNTAKIAGSSNITPALIGAHIKTSDNGEGIIKVDGEAAVIGDIGVGGAEFQRVEFETGNDNSRLYLSNATGGTATIDSGFNFNATQSKLMVLGDSHLTINGAITPGGAGKGSIVANGTTQAQALANAAAGNAFLGTTAYSGKTVTIANAVGDANNSLALVDVGNGTLDFTSAGGHIAIDTVNAGTGTVKFSGDNAVYRFNSLTSDWLTFSHNATIYANTGFLGTSTVPFAGTVAFDAAAGGARTIILQDGVHMNLSNVLAGTTNGNAHKMHFSGSHTIYSGLGTAASTFGELKVLNAGTVTFKEDLYATALDLGNANAKAVLEKNLTGQVTVGTNNHGVLTLAGGDKVITAVGNNAGTLRVGKVEVSQTAGTVANVTGQFAVNNLEFQTDSTLKLDHATTNITGDVTVIGGTVGKLQLGNSITLNADVGTAAGSSPLKELNIGSTTLTVAATKNLNTNITGSGTLAFAGATTSPMLNVGSAASALTAVNFAAGAASVQDVYATNINVNTGTVTLRNAIGTTNVTTGSATLLDGGSINVKGNAGGGGTLTVQGNATILGAGTSANALAVLNLTQPSGSVATLASGVTDIHAATVNHTNGTLTSGSSVTINGAYNMNNATLNLTGSGTQLISKGNVTLVGAVSLHGSHKSGTPIIDASDAATTLTDGALTSLTLNVAPVDGGDFKDGDVIIKAKTGTDLTNLHSKLSLVSKNAFRTVTATRVDNELKLAVADNTGAVLSQASLGANASSIQNLINDNPSLVTALGNAGTTAQVVKLVEQYTNNEAPATVTAQTPAAHQAVNSHTTQRVTNALGAVKRSRVTADSDLGMGVAAGSVAEKFGVWAEVSGGVASQGSRKGAAGYRSNMVSGVLGVDTMLNDKAIAGIAFGNVANNLKYKNNKSGDKIKSSSWMFTGYGSYSMNNDYFVRGNFVAGSNKAHSKELRGASIAHGKYNVESYSVEGAFGKSFSTADGGVITPSAGLRGYYVSSVNYDETGAGALNKSIKQKSRVSGALVANAEYTTEMKVGDYLINPEVHANLQCDLGSMKNSADFKPVSGSKYQKFVGAKSSRFSGRIGFSVSSSMNNIEYGLGYDADISDRYIGHEGTVKMKVSF